MVNATNMLSERQQQIVDRVVQAREARAALRLNVLSGPGSGKTRVVTEMLTRLAGSGARILATAFSRAAKIEMETRLAAAGVPPDAITIRTVHSLGFEMCRNAGYRKLDDDPDGRVFRQLRSSKAWIDTPRDDEIELAATIVRKAKARWTPERTPESLRGEVDVMLREEAGSTPLSVSLAVQDNLLHAPTDKGWHDALDFDDQVYLAARVGKASGHYDVVIVDEAQDITPVQARVIFRHCREDGILVLVGDPNQAIYRFSGADASIFSYAERMFSAEMMTLGQSFRCPRAVIAHVRATCPGASYLEAHTRATRGLVAQVDELRAGPGDLVLCRSLSGILDAVRAWRPAKRSTRLQVQAGNSRSLVFSVAERVRQRRASASGRELLSAVIVASPLVGWILSLQFDTAKATNYISFEAVLAEAELLFPERPAPNAVLFSTVHKQKGREADCVWIHTPSFRVSVGDPTVDLIEEQNIYYVACTRSKRDLLLLKS